MDTFYFFFYVVGLLTVTLLVAWVAHRRKAESKDIADISQAVLAACAILGASYWFLVERRGMPHADLALTAAVIPAEDGLVIVESTLMVKNVGQVRILLKDVVIQLQQAQPTELPLREIQAQGYDKWPREFQNKDLMYHNSELMWPLLREYRSSVKNSIEAGESDNIVSTFVVSCSINQVRIAAEVNVPGSSNWWKVRTFASVEEACKKTQAERGASK